MPVQTVQFETGETTCASKPGVFCPWVSFFGLGAHPTCTLFVLSLKAKDGWLQRHRRCLSEFETNTYKMPSLETFPGSEVDET